MFEAFPESIALHIHLGGRIDKSINTLEVKYQDCHVHLTNEVKYVIAMGVSKEGKTFYHANKVIGYTEENLKKYGFRYDF